jgi:hypothetical protein
MALRTASLAPLNSRCEPPYDSMMPVISRTAEASYLDATQVQALLSAAHGDRLKALKQAVMDGLIPRNIAGCKGLTSPQKRGKASHNPTQIKALLSAARGDRSKPFICSLSIRD